jgi:hypothetical protein
MPKNDHAPALECHPLGRGSGLRIGGTDTQQFARLLCARRQRNADRSADSQSWNLPPPHGHPWTEDRRLPHCAAMGVVHHSKISEPMSRLGNERPISNVRVMSVCLPSPDISLRCGEL